MHYQNFTLAKTSSVYITYRFGTSSNFFYINQTILKLVACRVNINNNTKYKYLYLCFLAYLTIGGVRRSIPYS